MGWLFSSKDWNVVAVIFERRDLFRINGNRGQGKDAEAMKAGAQKHSRTLYWAVFNQKGTFLEGGPGPASEQIPATVLAKLVKELPMTKTVQQVLAGLEKGEQTKLSKALEWNGYAVTGKAEENS